MKLITIEELHEHQSKQLNYFKKELPTSSTPKSLFNEAGDEITLLDTKYYSEDSIDVLVNEIEEHLRDKLE